MAYRKSFLVASPFTLALAACPLIWIGSVSGAALLPGESDVFGVRNITDPASMTPNQRDASGSIVDDTSLRETSDGFDLIGSSTGGFNVTQFDALYIAVAGNPNQVQINNGTIINLGVTGYAYLFEPGTMDPSDRISLVALQTVGALNRITFTLTLDSDPFNDNTAIKHNGFPENGNFQDLTGLVFNAAADPTHAGTALSANGNIPFHVFVQSDIETLTPEPSGLVLFAGGLLCLLAFKARRGRRSSRSATIQ